MTATVKIKIRLWIQTYYPPYVQSFSMYLFNALLLLKHMNGSYTRGIIVVVCELWRKSYSWSPLEKQRLHVFALFNQKMCLTCISDLIIVMSVTHHYIWRKIPSPYARREYVRLSRSRYFSLFLHKHACKATFRLGSCHSHLQWRLKSTWNGIKSLFLYNTTFLIETRNIILILSSGNLLDGEKCLWMIGK